MNFCAPQEFSIIDVIDGIPYICSNSIIEEDCIIGINVLDGVSREHTGICSIDETLTLCPVKMGDIVELHKQSTTENGFYRFRVVDIGTHFVTAVPDGGVIEI